MRKVLCNYNFTPDKSWLGDDYIIYDQSESDEWLKDFPPEKVIKRPHGGQVDYDKLLYLVDNYDDLPEVFLWGKTNLFKYITQEEYEEVKDNITFTPLLTKNHRTYSDHNGMVNYYADNIYWERNDNWYTHQFQSKYFHSFSDFAIAHQLPNPPYIPFAPGGNYILTREKVHRYSRDHYEKMAQILPYCFEPAEAQMCERSYYLMWH